MKRLQAAQDTMKKFTSNHLLPYDQEMKEIMSAHIFHDIYNHGQLSFELREYITIAVMCANGNHRLLYDHIVCLLERNITLEVIKEVIYHTIPYVGILKVDDALYYINKKLIQDGYDIHTTSQASVREATRFRAGFEIQCDLFTREKIQENHDTASDTKHIQNYLSAHCFGDFYTRLGLDLKTRELLTFCVIASLGGCESQLRSHTIANRSIGNTKEVMMDAITQCQPYIGFPRTLNAIQVIECVCGL